MKVSTKLVAGFGLLIGLLAVVMVYHVSTLRDSVQTSAELSSIVARLTVSSTEQLQRLDQMQESAGKFAVTGDTGYSAAFERARRAYAGALRELEGLPLTGREREAVGRLSGEWRDRFPPERTLEGMMAGLSGPAADGELGWLDTSLDRLRRSTRSLTQASQQAMAERVRASTDAARDAERVSWAAVVAALVASLLVAGFIVRSITESLRRLKEGTRAVANGDFGYRLDVEREDEFSELAADFNVMTEKLGELDRAKRGFLSQVSHDLKSPLASMQETGQLLLSGLPGQLNGKQRHLLELQHRSGTRLSALISRLLDLARLQEGALEYEFREDDLSPLVRLVADDFQSRLEDRSLRLVTQTPEEPVTAPVDRDRIVEVVDNLLDNAVRHAPRGSQIELRVTTTREAPEAVEDGAGVLGYAVVTVGDAGPGVPDADKEKIFERFYQGGDGKAGERSGVGLGLALCREIVGAHGGGIWVRDREPRGSVFCVALPLAGREAGLPEPAAAEPVT
ncbi:MAG TPA: ATP-binding protein [Gemmatimonadota bacterium]|nr:ATP-binding protein [Gemmatimonadota bacterium]